MAAIHTAIPYGDTNRPVLRPNRWNTEVCQCAEDTSSCIEVCFCWHAQMTAQVNKLYYNGKEPMICACLAYFICDIWFCLIPSAICVAMTRSGVRNRYMLDCNNEECCVECCLYICGCWPCMQCQNHREMHMRGDYPGGCLTEENPRFIRARPAPTMGFPQNVTYTTTVISLPTSSGVSYPQQQQMVTYPQAPGYGAPPRLMPLPQQAYPYTPNSTTCPPTTSGFAQYPYNNNTQIYPQHHQLQMSYPQPGYPQQPPPQPVYPQQQPAFANQSAPYSSAPIVGVPISQNQSGYGQQPQVQFYNNPEY